MANLPSWLVESRENALKTQEWNNLTTNIYDAVDQHLAQSHVQYFTDLSDAEKSLVLERAAKSLKGTTNGGPTPYDNLNKRVSDLLDKGVNNDVSRSLMTDDPLETKTDIILNKVCEGIIALLRKWPDQKYKLHAFLNQSLPQPVRFVGWNLYLSNINYRQKFINDLGNNPRSVLSPMDAEIQRNCDSLVRTLPVATDMIDSKGNMSAMKAILSYYHSMFSNKRDLVDSEYYYVIPIVLSHNPPLSRSEKPYEKSLSLLTEMYRTFLDTMPPILRDVYLNSSTHELEPWFHKVEFHLKEIDRPVYNHMRTVLYPPDSHMSTNDDPYVLVFLKKCCYPWFKYMFVGCLTADPLMFVWDQYLITSDIPKFHDELIPAIAAAMIITLRDFLLKCKMTSEMESILQHKTNIIITRQLQSVIVRFFLAEFKSRIARSDFGPVIDPTEGRQWTSYNKDHVPPAANRPEQRLTDRERNEQNAQLERRLREEMNKRQENERSLQTKIEQLQYEIDQMKYSAGPVVTRQSIRAPTPIEQYVNPRSRPITPVKPILRQQQGKSPIHDLLRKIAQTVNRVAHGEGKNSVALDEQTKHDIRVHKLDLKMAEREAVGRTLQANEWNQLSDQQKQVYSQKMLEVVKTRIQSRYTDGRK
ncbi:unnamed protein product [Rotaria magnacalcarata]|uniref:Uncharacterized protein n=3 Tax=Rotaria magnacalcarata TaxID=392030 RepID=A0A814IPE3_9BILA|nr:unnamed protein product [Rotaria magnacalcarata]CAF1651171.1 unnamed protein product [Rotaria magnacalcarata]CAF1958754.1 unnamed protein product [Rotaria magnacalcarata]CAF2070751.1 unnamed protein product [Rotaria magnacalcarata]CAF2171497.1 unnamed protein product [Rotaria magnacalcarata]